MTDKETLILAAKAAGLSWDSIDCTWFSANRGDIPNWSPLTSNDDCFRMETALGLDIVWWKDRVVVWSDAPHGYTQEYFADHNGDKDKARRYASTRAAALRGRE